MRGPVLLVLLWIVASACRPAATPAPELQPITAAQLRQKIQQPGATLTLVNMWATWCGPCRAEFPDLLKLRAAYEPKGVRFVFISWDDNAGTPQDFLRSHRVTFPTYLKSAADGNQAFIEAAAPQWSGAFPATMLYDQTGNLRAFWEGQETYAQMEQRLLAALKPQPPGVPSP